MRYSFSYLLLLFSLFLYKTDLYTAIKKLRLFTVALFVVSLFFMIWSILSFFIYEKEILWLAIFGTVSFSILVLTSIILMVDRIAFRWRLFTGISTFVSCISCSVYFGICAYELAMIEYGLVSTIVCGILCATLFFLGCTGVYLLRNVQLLIQMRVIDKGLKIYNCVILPELPLIIESKDMVKSKVDVELDNECYLPTNYAMDNDVEAALIPRKEPKKELAFDSMFIMGTPQGYAEDDITMTKKVRPAYIPKFVHYDELSDDTGEVTATELAIIRVNPLMSRIYITCHHDLFMDDDMSAVTMATYKTAAIFAPQNKEPDRDDDLSDATGEVTVMEQNIILAMYKSSLIVNTNDSTLTPDRFDGYASNFSDLHVDDEDTHEIPAEKSYALSSTYIMNDDYRNDDGSLSSNSSVDSTDQLSADNQRISYLLCERHT